MSWLQLIPLFVFLTTLTIAIITASWKLSAIATKVELILTNHLPHLQDDLKDLRHFLEGR